jgi:hypothetical protein
MYNLKRRFPLSLPPRGNPARLPALLVPVLGLAAVAQLFVPHDVMLPPPGAVGRGVRAAAIPDVAAIATPPALLRRALFAPAAAIGGDRAPADLLGGAVFAGAVQQGGHRVAVVQLPQGRIRYLAPGGEVAGWRLQALLPGGVRLVRGDAVATVDYGQRATVSTGAPAQSQSEDPQ